MENASSGLLPMSPNTYRALSVPGNRGCLRARDARMCGSLICGLPCRSSGTVVGPERDENWANHFGRM
jgi:hypothetical protein